MRAYSVFFVVLAIGCRERPKPTPFSAPPPTVVASFTAFGDSVRPRISRVLDSLGFHMGDDDSSKASTFDLDVSPIVPDEARAKVFEADMTFSVHNHAEDFRTAFIALDFVSVGDAPRWALLTKDGYPYTSLKDSGVNDLPLDVQLGIRSAFKDRIELSEWYAYRRAKVPSDTAQSTRKP